MPNIIEQQDLLKGLPDNRIAMLLQNPAGDIPPFLVAAEAQRRQSIRQQFAGGPQESVVDTLTKQISGVPQNIQTPAQTPPTVPQTPPMQGVMALQQQQAMQQAAQQVMPQQQQQMRHGGMVQRYQAGSLVEPSFRGRAGSMGYLGRVEEPSYFSSILGDVGQSAGQFLENMKQFGFNMTPEQREILKVESEKRAAEERGSSDLLPIAPTGEIPPGLGRTDEISTPNAKIPRRTTPTTNENPTPPPPPKPQPGETEDEFRARLAALYGGAEVSDWEKAQRWFAMAEQFLDPSKTTMQSIAGAGRAFADMSSEQSRAERDAMLQKEKALLEYDIAKVNEAREQAALQQERKDEALKARTGIATGQLDDLRRERRDIAERMNDIISDAQRNGLIDDAGVNDKIAALQKIYNELGNQIAVYETYITDTYNFPRLPQADLATGKIIP
jgi:hypothetical protein